MKNLSILICFTLYIFSCTDQENKKDTQRTENRTQPEILYQTLNKKGVLLGKDIKMLLKDSNYKDISYLNKRSVDILGISEKFYKTNSNDDTCKSFKYVKIKVDNLEGVVKGDLVYELDMNNKENKQLKTVNNDIEFIPAHNYVMKAFDDNQMPTGCTNVSPVLLHNKKTKDFTLIKLVNKNIYYDDCDYLYFIGTEVAFDVIDKVYEENNKINLIWKIYAQDGSYVDMLISVYLKNNEIVGEIIHSTKKR
ncbi:MAG: hypothetical protein MUC49_06685 [Raineya sp.]|jgi:hypothetical protein|nr:hypothetical protein [Raineya sp.]